MVAKHEEWWAKMEEEVGVTFWEVFSETSSIDLVRLHPCCISTTANPFALPTCYMSEALATTVQWRARAPMATTTLESGGQQALVSMSSPVWQTETPPLPSLPLSKIPIISTPLVGHSLNGFLFNPQHTKWDCFPNGDPDNHPSKRAHAKTTEAEVSSGYSTPQGDEEPPQTQLEVPNNGVGASRSTEEDNTDHSGNESTQDKSRENAADSDLELASVDCLTCSDVEEVVVRTAQNRFWKRVMVSCNILRGCLWSEAQVWWIKDSHQAIWYSNHEVNPDRAADHSQGRSHLFEVNRMTFWNWTTTLDQGGHPL